MVKEQIKKLQIGCGNNPLKCYINLDFVNYNGKVDVIWDLEKILYPFKDNSFEEVYAHHVLEHMKNTVKVLEELHRICKNKAIIKIYVPHFACNTSLSHLTHYKSFSYRTFDLLENRSEIYTSKNFKIVHKRLVWTNSEIF